MFLGLSVETFLNQVIAFYDALPNEGKLIACITVILIFIASILLIIMIEQRRLNKKIVNKKIEVSDDTEILDFDFDEIDEMNEKTRNLKEITDKIQAVIDSRAIELTNFEQDQEENSIISYEELMKSVGKPVESPTQDFSLPNLVRKIEVDEEIEKDEPYLNPIPIREGKFKSSAIISPVYGIQEPHRVNKTEKPKPKLKTEEIPIHSNFNEEETFLSNLISFRKNLE
jgi:hypothetical protein